jgi:hypothetical protein
VIPVRLLSFVLLLTVFNPLEPLNAQVSIDGLQNMQSMQAAEQTDKADSPDDYQNHTKYPQPYAYGGLGMSRGAGYRPAYAEAGAGFMINTQHVICNAVATYDNGRKVADGTGNNPKGHDRGLASTAYYKFPNRLFLGVGASWSELSTTNYSKQGWSPSVGGGWDYLNKNCAAENCVVEWSFRAQVDYLLKGTEHVNRQGCPVPNGQCTNGVEGPQFVLSLPSPVSNSHFIFREALGLYESHATITSTDPALSAEQLGQRSMGRFADFALLYRF